MIEAMLFEFATDAQSENETAASRGDVAARPTATPTVLPERHFDILPRVLASKMISPGFARRLLNAAAERLAPWESPLLEPIAWRNIHEDFEFVN